MALNWENQDRFATLNLTPTSDQQYLGLGLTVRPGVVGVHLTLEGSVTPKDDNPVFRAYPRCSPTGALE